MKLLLIVEKQKMDCFERHKIKGIIASINQMPLTAFPMPAWKKYTAFFGLREIMKTGSNRQVPVGMHLFRLTSSELSTVRTLTYYLLADRYKSFG
jgi:hypothetical protein